MKKDENEYLEKWMRKKSMQLKKTSSKKLKILLNLVKEELKNRD